MKHPEIGDEVEIHDLWGPVPGLDESRWHRGTVVEIHRDFDGVARMRVTIIGHGDQFWRRILETPEWSKAWREVKR